MWSGAIWAKSQVPPNVADNLRYVASIEFDPDTDVLFGPSKAGVDTPESVMVVSYWLSSGTVTDISSPAGGDGST